MPGFSEKLKKAILRTGGCLCVGLDPDLSRLPEGLPPGAEGMRKFLEEIVAATKDLAAAYKPNLAFFEAFGSEGWRVLETVRREIPADCLVVADAKRGDIGSTSAAYAEALFGGLGADAVTVSPYLGRDSVEPFLSREGTCAFVLALTSNPGAVDFQELSLKDGGLLYETVARKALSWAGSGGGEVGLVVGATRSGAFANLRAVAPAAPFLVPGVGAQGGDLEAVLKSGRNAEGYGILVNASRSVLYASRGGDFAEAARREAARLSAFMRPFFRKPKEA